jgi:hypothetical protein
MEEILASIRRIIADDDASKPPSAPAAPPPKAVPPPPPPRAAPAPPPRPAPPPAPAPAPPAAASQIDTTLDELDKPAPAAEKKDVLELTEAMTAAPSEGFRTIDGQPDVMFEERQPAMSAADRKLLSTAASAAVDSAFNTLAHTILVQNARTLEDLVREMLRPLLKSWLDDNLPKLVERLVRAEIERVSRGQR